MSKIWPMDMLYSRNAAGDSEEGGNQVTGILNKCFFDYVFKTLPGGLLYFRNAAGDNEEVGEEASQALQTARSSP